MLLILIINIILLCTNKIPMLVILKYSKISRLYFLLSIKLVSLNYNTCRSYSVMLTLICQCIQHKI